MCMPARSTMITGQYVRTHGVVRQRRPAARRRAEHRRLPERERLPHRAAGQGPLRAGLRPRRSLAGEPARPGRTTGAAPRLRAPRAGHARRRSRSGTTAPGCMACPTTTSSTSTSCSTAAGLNNAGGGETGAPQTKINPMPRELVPHRLGRRPRRSPGSTASMPTRTGSAG